MTPDQILASLHTKVAEELVKRIESGEASAAEMSVAVKFLKDNGIDADKLTNPALGKLSEALQLPFDDEAALDEIMSGKRH